MKENLITEISRINEIMGTPPLLVEQAAWLKGLRTMLGVGDVAKVVLKFDDIAAKIPALNDAYVLRLKDAGTFPPSVKTVSQAKDYVAKGMSSFLSGKKITSPMAEVLVRLAGESDDMLKIFAKEVADKAKSMGLKLEDILQSNEMRIQFQKLLADPQIGLHLQRGIPDDVLSKIADDFIINGGKLKAIINDNWWARLWTGINDMDQARIYAIDRIFNKFLTNKSYFNVRNFISELADSATAKKILEKTPYGSAGELADVVTDALSKGKELGRVELEALQLLMANNNKYRTVLYETLGQSQYVKSYIRDIPVNKITPEQADDFFIKLIGSSDPNDVMKFKNSLGFKWNPFAARTWSQLVDPTTYKYTFLKAKDVFFSPTRYPRFFRFYWISMGSSALINWLYSLILSFSGWLPIGETKSKAGLKPDFYLKLRGAKTLVLDEGGLDDDQAKTIAEMLNSLLNVLFSMNDNIDELYSDFKDSDHGLEAIVMSGVTTDNLAQNREVFKAFSDWIEDEGYTEGGIDGFIGDISGYATGVSDSGIQSIYKDLIPTILASSQVTYYYDDVINQEAGKLNSDLGKLEPILHAIPVPILTRLFTDGKKEIMTILDNKRWMKSVAKEEHDLGEIVKVALAEWPTFPETLKTEDGETLWSKWSGPIPPSSLATMMDGQSGAKGSQPPYEVGEDQQYWIKNLTAEEFNRGFCLAVEGECASPYGWTADEIDSATVKVLEAEQVLSEHMSSFLMDLENIKELLSENPDRLCKISPKLCDLLKIVKESHNQELENN